MSERLLTPNELQQLMLDVLKLIGGDEKFLPKTDEYKGISDLYIEIGKYGYEYVRKDDRGNETSRQVPVDLNDLLYLVFYDVTYNMAVFDKSVNRNAPEDYRQSIFNKQLALLTKLSPKWADRMRR